MNRLRRHLLAVVILLCLSAVAFADPPNRVARLQYVSGSVSVQPQGQNDWVEGTLNRPLTNSDNIWTDKDSRAELDVGDGVLRLNSESSLTLTNIGNDTVQVQLHQGTLNVRVRHLYSGEIYEIDTPNMAFTVQKSGEYRFDVNPDTDTTLVTVWKGEGDATGNGPAVRVHAHERARFTNATSMENYVSDAPDPDGFDDWARVRDRREDNSVSARYVAPGTIGAGDLDDYGTWSEVPPYGRVWVPAVAPGWAPYRFGHWIWLDPWGWTWVDDAPWGFAPFHYGRWAYIGDYWGWVPGPIYAPPIWSPALVAWFGGPGWGVSFGFGFGGGLGWCPLGFGEPFFPWYGVSRGYFRNVNINNTRITNITNITNNYYNNYYGSGARGVNGKALPFHYANMNRPGGFTAVPRGVVTGARPVGNAVMRVPQGALSNARAISRAPVDPSRTSRLGSKAGRPAAAPARGITNRPVYSRLGSPNGRPGQGGMQRSVNAGNRPQTGNMGRPGPAMSTASNAHNVPRPPQRGMSGQPAGNGQSGGQRNGAPAMAGNGRSQPGNSHYVPRPPQSGSMAANRAPNDLPRSSGMSSRGNQAGFGSSNSHYVPRPQSGSVVRGSGNAGRGNVQRGNGNVSRGSSYSGPSSSYRSSGGYSTRASVPRPTGRVLPGGNYSRESSSSYGGGGSYGRSAGGGYNDNPRYVTPSRPQWGGNSGGYSNRGGGYDRGGSYGGSYNRGGGSSPSYSRGGGYSGGGGGYSGGSHGGYSGGGGSYGGGSHGGYSGGGHSGSSSGGHSGSGHRG